MSTWSKTPPSEPGWYWWREDEEDADIMTVCSYGDDDFAIPDWGEWWTTPIEEPSR